MSPEATIARPDLDQLVAHYRDLLGLRDWTITARWVDGDGPLGYVIPTPTRKLAELCVSSRCPPEEIRATVAHELIHALLSPLTHTGEPSPAAVMLEEQATEALALAVVRAEQSPADAAVMRKALERLDPRAVVLVRTRVAAAEGRRRSRMDPKVLAALALEGGALMANEGLPEEVTAWIKKAVEAMSGSAVEETAEVAAGDEPAPPAEARDMGDEEDDAETRPAPARAAAPSDLADDALGKRLRHLFAGATTHDEIEGRVRAALADAKDAQELRAAAAKDAKAKARRAKDDAEAALRAKLSTAVRAGKFARAELFDVSEGVDADGKPVEVFVPKAWAREMAPKALEAMIAAKQARSTVGAPPIVPEEGAVNISAAVREYGRARGYSDAQIAALAAQLPHTTGAKAPSQEIAR